MEDNLVEELKNIRQSEVSPKYLHSNSTSHKWAFGAVAELIDNAYDPDVYASSLKIDHETVNNQRNCLTFTDDGNGLDADGMHRMLSFGFSDKKDQPDHKAVGQYGNGFKSGSMRLGKDAIVFSKCYNENTKTTIMAIGFLSQTFLADINATAVLVPIVSWKQEGNHSPEMISTKDADPSLRAILNHSIFINEAQLFQEFEHIGSHKGTRIIIYNLKRDKNNHLEFDFKKNKEDIIITEEYESNQPAESNDTDMAEYKYSLRAYCSILYIGPKLRVYLRKRKVINLFVEKSVEKHLTESKTYDYRPQNVELDSGDTVKMKFGFSKKGNQYGVMMYYKNRLIQPYVPVGYQRQPDERGVGVIGVVECNFLEPTHNKQDFLENKVYGALIKALGDRLNRYWKEKRETSEPKRGRKLTITGFGPKKSENRVPVKRPMTDDNSGPPSNPVKQARTSGVETKNPQPQHDVNIIIPDDLKYNVPSTSQGSPPESTVRNVTQQEAQKTQQETTTNARGSARNQQMKNVDDKELIVAELQDQVQEFPAERHIHMEMNVVGTTQNVVTNDVYQRSVAQLENITQQRDNLTKQLQEAWVNAEKEKTNFNTEIARLKGLLGQEKARHIEDCMKAENKVTQVDKKHRESMQKQIELKGALEKAREKELQLVKELREAKEKEEKAVKELKETKEEALKMLEEMKRKLFK